MNDTLKLPFKISSYEINPNANARLTTLANFYQEMAYEHARILGVGYDYLKKSNITWVLSRMKISVNKYPKWNDELMIETWPHGVEKLFALRDYRIWNKNKEVMAEGLSLWLMVDINTHRPIRITQDFIDVIQRTDSVYDTLPGKIKLPDEMKERRIHRVHYSDLDVVGHVNNVKYIEWCTDTIDQEIVLNSGVKDIEINFISECKLHEEISISCSEVIDNKIYISAQNLTREKESFRAILTV